MHTLGKVLTWFVVIFAAVAFVLTGRMLDVRNTWAKKLNDVKTQNEQLAKDLEEKSAHLAGLRQELANTMLGWEMPIGPNGNLAFNIPMAPAGDGTITSNNFGSNDGLGVPVTPEQPVVYLFNENPADGTSKYLGQFQVTTLRENQAQFKPTWRLRGDEATTWPANANYRVRTMIPAETVARFNDAYTDLTHGDELLADKQKHLKIQTELVDVSNKHLKHRQEELLGYETPPPGADQLPAEWTVGLVAAMAEEEESRNEELAKLDQLRRDVKAAYELLAKLIRENTDLVRTLPGPDFSTPAPAVSSK